MKLSEKRVCYYYIYEKMQGLHYVTKKSQREH